MHLHALEKERATPWEEAPQGCYEGWVYLGFAGEDELEGESVEVIERVPCRKCNPGKL